MVKIIHFHAETKSNIGDAAIVFAIRDILKSSLGISMYTSKNIASLKKRDYPRIIGIILKNPAISQFIPQKLLLDKILRSMQKTLNNILLNNINKHDLMIVGGGGLYSSWFFPLNNELIMKIKIPIVIWGVGYRHNFGDKSLSKDQLESIILLNKKARLSSVRDQISKEFLKGLGLEVDCIGDPAIFLKGKSTKIVFNTKIKIGINIAYHGWKLQEKYIVQILNFYRNLLNGLEKRYSPQFFYLRHHPNENKIIRKLKREFPKITICDYGPYQMKTIYENLDFVINMMLHSSIFAFSSNTSMINIAYDEKNIAFMKSINKEDRIIDVRKLNSEKIDDIINLMPVLIKKDDNLVKVKEEFKIRIDEFIQKIKLL